MPETKGIRIARWIIIALFLAAWQLAGSESQRLNFFFATPAEVVSEFWKLAVTGEFFEHTLITGSEALGGLLLGTILGTAAGLALWLSSTLAAVTRPFVTALSSLPIFAIAPLMIVWFGVDMKMKVAFAALATVFVAFEQAYRGAHSVSREFVDLLRGFGAPPSVQFRKVVVPASINSVLAGLQVNTGLSLLGAFIGEFVAANRGLGFLIVTASGLYNVPRAFVGAIGIVLLAVLFRLIVDIAVRRRGWLVQVISVPRIIRAYSTGAKNGSEDLTE
jgi:NitT/TauT family transport system permease protein